MIVAVAACGVCGVVIFALASLVCGWLLYRWTESPNNRLAYPVAMDYQPFSKFNGNGGYMYRDVPEAVGRRDGVYSRIKDEVELGKPLHNPTLVEDSDRLVFYSPQYPPDAAVGWLDLNRNRSLVLPTTELRQVGKERCLVSCWYRKKRKRRESVAEDLQRLRESPAGVSISISFSVDRFLRPLCSNRGFATNWPPTESRNREASPARPGDCAEGAIGSAAQPGTMAIFYLTLYDQDGTRIFGSSAGYLYPAALPLQRRLCARVSALAHLFTFGLPVEELVNFAVDRGWCKHQMRSTVHIVRQVNLARGNIMKIRIEPSIVVNDPTLLIETPLHSRQPLSFMQSRHRFYLIPLLSFAAGCLALCLFLAAVLVYAFL